MIPHDFHTKNKETKTPFEKCGNVHLCRIVDSPAAGPGLVAVPVVEAEQRGLVAQRETGDRNMEVPC